MNFNHQNLKGNITLLLLISTTLGCILISIYCLQIGYTIIFQNLFYIPIILACVFYFRKGFLISCFLALIYFSLIVVYSPDPATLLQAFIRVILFIGIAGVITYLTIAGKRSEEKYRLLAENSYDVIYLMDVNGKFSYVSPSCFQFSGFTPEDIVHKSLDTVVSQDSLPVITEAMKKASEMIQSGDHHPIDLIEVEFLKKDGTTVWAELSPQIVLDAQKNPIGFLGVSRDISKRRIAEQALRESEEKFIAIFQKTPDPTIIIGPDLQIIEANQGFESIFGLINSEIKGTKLENTTLINLISRIGSPDSTTISQQVVQQEEVTFTNQSGTPFIAEVTISPITIQNKPCLIVQIHDIDEIRRAHNAVAQVNHKLKILSSITRHDILNRVMVTSFYSEELKNAITDPKLQKQTEAIFISSGEIRDLITFTGQYQELGAEDPGWQHINKILNLREVQGLLKGVTLTTDLGDLQIYADMMLEKVMYNLVENSVRHGQNLTWIKLTCHEEGANLVIEYEDDGGGIAQDEKEKVFEKGFGKNTGLGLFLIREILSITGITIIETGVPGTGVTFEIRVPAGRFRRAEG